jgi:hypothetical protein
MNAPANWDPFERPLILIVTLCVLFLLRLLWLGFVSLVRYVIFGVHRD